jgi:hypothetical protein
MARSASLPETVRLLNRLFMWIQPGLIQGLRGGLEGGAGEGRWGRGAVLGGGQSSEGKISSTLCQKRREFGPRAGAGQAEQVIQSGPVSGGHARFHRSIGRESSMSEKPGAGARGQGAGAIAALLDENRTYPPAPAFTAQANVPDESITPRPSAIPRILGRRSRRSWMVRLGSHPRWKAPDARGSSAGSSALPTTAWTATCAGPEKAAIVWGASGRPADRYWDPSRVCRLRTAEEARRRERGPRGDLHADGPRVPIAMLACARTARSTRRVSDSPQGCTTGSTTRRRKS